MRRRVHRSVQLGLLFVRVMSRQLGWRGWTILSVVAVVAVMIPISNLTDESGSRSSSDSPTRRSSTPSSVSSSTSSTSSAARDTSAEDRRKGFHCLDPWDGNHNGLEALIRDRLNDPGSMETIVTRIAPADAQGDHRIQLEFTAKNAYGGRVRHMAHGWVDQATCNATLTLIE